jgi:hypothetical protein
MLAYLLYYKPLTTSLLNALELFNESILLLSSYYLLLYVSPEVSVDSQYASGWSLIGLTLFNIAVNMSLMIVSTVQYLVTLSPVTTTLGQV